MVPFSNLEMEQIYSISIWTCYFAAFCSYVLLIHLLFFSSLCYFYFPGICWQILERGRRTRKMRCGKQIIKIAFRETEWKISIIIQPDYSKWHKVVFVIIPSTISLLISPLKYHHSTEEWKHSVSSRKLILCYIL